MSSGKFDIGDRVRVSTQSYSCSEEFGQYDGMLGIVINIDEKGNMCHVKLDGSGIKIRISDSCLTYS